MTTQEPKIHDAICWTCCTPRPEGFGESNDWLYYKTYKGVVVAFCPAHKDRCDDSDGTLTKLIHIEMSP